MKRTRPAPREIGSRSRSELGALYRWVHALEPEWWTAAITFQRGPEWVRFTNSRWRVQCSFHGARWGWTRNSHIRYSVSIALSPGAELTSQQRLALRRAGAYARVANAVGKLGYQGKWHQRGSFGLFSKDLRSLAAVRQEVGRLQGISFKDLFADAGRRTMR